MVFEVNLAVVSGHTDVADLDIALLASPHQEYVLPSLVEKGLLLISGMQDMDHPRVLLLECQRFQDHVVGVGLGDLHQWVLQSVHRLENIWQCGLADIALELPPVDAGVVLCGESELLGFDPALEASVVDELDTTPALAYLEQWVRLCALVIPADTALGAFRLRHRVLVGNDLVGCVCCHWVRAWGNLLLLSLLLILLITLWTLPYLCLRWHLFVEGK